MAYHTIGSHARMALDSVRNDAYAHALRQVIRPDSVVLDLGAGTGVLGLMAARMGARRVYLVEPSDIIAVAQEIVHANRLQDVVQCVHGRLEEATIPEPVDVIISVMTGNFLVTEDLLPILFDARARLLKPGGHLVPSAAAMEATLVSAPKVYAAQVEAWCTPQHGVDLGAARPYAANSIAFGPAHLSESTFLAEPATLLTLDFDADAYGPVHANVELEVAEAGLCDGVVGWFRMRLGDRWVSTSPKAKAMHWSAAYLPLDPPLALERGDRVSLQIDRHPKGDWSWRVRSGGESRRHSTMLAWPLTPATLQKGARAYVPQRSDEVEAAAFVIASVNGSASVETIAASLRDRFPDRYTTLDAAIDFTQRIVSGV